MVCLAERLREELDPQRFKRPITSQRATWLHRGDRVYTTNYTCSLSPHSLSPSETYPPGRRERPRSVTGASCVRCRFSLYVGRFALETAEPFPFRAAPHRAPLPSISTASFRVTDFSKRKRRIHGILPAFRSVLTTDPKSLLESRFLSLAKKS